MAAVRTTERARVRKRRGAWYTPEPYVEAIVGRALRDRLRDATYEDVLACTVLDPACGDGVFLAAAYRLLLARALAVRGGDALAPAERTQIAGAVMRACIHGVDVDAGALTDAAARLGEAATLVHADALAAPWESLFPGVFARGGFAFVVANPPYVFGEWLAPATLASLQDRFASLGGQPDLYAAFLELTVTRLCAPGGTYAFVVPDAMLVRAQRAPLRAVLAEHAMPSVIAHPGAIFTGDHAATVSAAIVMGTRGRSNGIISVERVSADGSWSVAHGLPARRVRDDPARRLLIAVRPEEWETFDRVATAATLADVVLRISRGEETGKKHLRARAGGGARVAVVPGEAIRPFALGTQRRYVAALRKRAGCYAAPKILVRKTDGRVIACRDVAGVATLQSVYNVHVAPRHIDLVLALLNSRFAQWYFARTVTAYKKLMPQITQAELLTLPLPRSASEYGALVAAAERGDSHAAAAIDERLAADFGIPAFP